MITFKAKAKTGEFFKSGLSAMNFPAGEAHTKLDPNRELEPTEIAILHFETDTMHDDLFKLAMWNDHIRREEPKADAPLTKRVLILPYFPGARQDRGVPFGLNVYFEFIDQMHLHQVIILDPHSFVLEEYAKRSKGDRAEFAVKTEYTFVYTDELLPNGSIPASDYDGVIAPDKGAVARTQKVADSMGLPMFRAGKSRDPDTGKLSGFHMEDELPEGKFLIVDDICDGGGTFLGLFDSIHNGQPDDKPVELDLFVSHGVFSKNAVETLPMNFGHVYTTNSYNPKRHLPAGMSRLPIINFLLQKVN